MKKLIPALVIALALLILAAPIIAQAATTATVVLNWTDNTNPAGTGYNVRRGTTATACTTNATPTDTCTLLNTVPLTVKTYTDTPTLGTNYFYYVRAVNAAGVESLNSNVATASLAKPTAPTVTCTITITGGIVNGTCQ